MFISFTVAMITIKVASFSKSFKFIIFYLKIIFAIFTVTVALITTIVAITVFIIAVTIICLTIQLPAVVTVFSFTPFFSCIPLSFSCSYA
jgi:hypothetical protein